MTRAHKVLPAVGAAAAGLLLAATPASAGPADSLQGLTLTGVCPGAEGDPKDVVVMPRSGSLWAPYRLLNDRLVPTGSQLHATSVQVGGVGLKSRHLLPGTVYTKQGAAKATQTVVCEFAGTTADGPFWAEITGVVR